MLVHENEVDFRSANESERLTYMVLATDLGENHVAALKEQFTRQGVELVTDPTGF